MSSGSDSLPGAATEETKEKGARWRMSQPLNCEKTKGNFSRIGFKDWDPRISSLKGDVSRRSTGRA